MPPKRTFTNKGFMIDKLLAYQRDNYLPVERQFEEYQRTHVDINYLDAIFELSQEIEERLEEHFQSLRWLSEQYNSELYEDYVPGEDLPTREELQEMPLDRISHMFIRLTAYTQAIENVVPMVVKG